MKHSIALAIFGLVFTASGAPAHSNSKRQIVGLPVGPEIDNSDIPYSAAGPVDASGNVYGDHELLGNAGDGKSPSSVGSEVAPPTGSNEELAGPYELAAGQDADANLGLFLDLDDVENPQPIRGGNGAVDSGPRNEAIQRQNSDLLARPGTDMGDIPNAKWPMGLSSTRSGTGGGNPGWARQQNTNELPVAASMASVDMNLAPNAYRELHWHSANEWAYILNGGVRIAAVNQNGESFVDDLEAGDLWYAYRIHSC